MRDEFVQAWCWLFFLWLSWVFGLGGFLIGVDRMRVGHNSQFATHCTPRMSTLSDTEIATELASIATQQQRLTERVATIRKTKADKYMTIYREAITSIEPLVREQLAASKTAHVDDVITECYRLLGDTGNLEGTRIGLTVVEDLVARYGHDFLKWQKECGGSGAALKPLFEMGDRIKNT